MMEDLESESEALARKHLEPTYGTLNRVSAGGTSGPVRDFETEKCWFEVKEVVSSPYAALRAQLAKKSFFENSSLEAHWDILLSPELSAGRFQEIREIPDGPDELYEKQEFPDGSWFRQTRPSETAEKLRAARDMPRQNIPSLGKISNALFPLVRQLEKLGVFEIRQPSSYFGDDPVDDLLGQCLALTGGNYGFGFRHEKAAPGIQFNMSYGGVTTFRSETLVGRIQSWLDSPESTNLRASLGSKDHTNVGVLVVGSFHDPEPESEVALKDPEGFVPTRPLVLPEELDQLVLVIKTLAYRFSRPEGWSLISKVDL
jgi:hypothetical protein